MLDERTDTGRTGYDAGFPADNKILMSHRNKHSKGRRRRKVGSTKRRSRRKQRKDK